ncbi:MAG: ATP-binding cassette domain-containing protein [Actinomycetota bacterium]
MIRLTNVSKTYKSRQVLAPTTFAAPQGQVHALVGPSGCGKSTLLRLMMGLIAPDSGEVMVNGRAVTPAAPREHRHGIGYVIQDGGLFPHLTAAGNVSLLASELGWDRKRIAARQAELAALVHFPEDGLERFPLQLSGGQRQRVGLMRALMLDPPVLLMDEPLGALDPLIRARLQQDLREIFSRLGKTVVIVTHDLAEAAYLGQVISVMRAGRIVQTGTLAQLVNAPADPYVTEFISAQRTDWMDGVRESNA